MKCVICKKEIKPLKENKFFPFCSKKCRLVDLYSWLNEEYSISEPLPNTAEDPEKPEKFWRN